MKNLLALLLILTILALSCAAPALAVDGERSYEFRLSIDDQLQKNAESGQLITATLLLKRTDKNESALMRAMQAEIEYDGSFLELVESSVITARGVEWTDMARRTGDRAFYLNYLSLSGGEEWESEVVMGVFQFKVLGEQGVSTIHAVNCLVSAPNGVDSYRCVSNDVQVIVSTECTVRFESNGGTELESVTVQYGEKLPRPADPKRKGYSFAGWYKDLDRTELWDFDNDVVRGNMTLYAAWTEGESAAISSSAVTGIGIVGLLLAAALVFIINRLRKKREE